MGEQVQGISIVVPVGPQKAYLKYLDECLFSIRDQMTIKDELVIVDDMADIRYKLLPKDAVWVPDNLTYIENAWLLGCAASWNVGVASAKNEWCVLMGSDDKLLPGCLDACREVISNNPDPLGYYNFTCVNDKGEEFDWFNNAAMVSKTLWRYTGGYGPSAFASPDGWLISIMLKHVPEHLHQLKHRTPLYWCRTHSEQDTQRMAAFFHGEVISIRDKETARFKPNPEWAQSK